MKWINYLFVSVSLCAGQSMLAQDAATQERLDKLNGQIEACLENQQALTKKLEALSRELEKVREQASKPSGNYASDEDLKRVADAVKEVDQKRLADYEKIRTELKSELKNLSKAISTSAPTPKPHRGTSTTSSDTVENSGGPSEGFEYEIQKNDTLSVIVQAYREKNIKVTVDQILKANPGLDPNKLKVGKKIFIPKPQS